MSCTGMNDVRSLVRFLPWSKRDFSHICNVQTRSLTTLGRNFLTCFCVVSSLSLPPPPPPSHPSGRLRHVRWFLPQRRYRRHTFEWGRGQQAKHRRFHAWEITCLRHVLAVEYYSCTGRGRACTLQRTCAWVRMSTLLHLHASDDTHVAVDHFLLRSSHSLACIVLHYAVDQWPVGDRQRPFTARKTRKTSFLYIKTQRKGDTTRSRSSNETSSPTRGNTEPAWTSPFSPSF